MSEDKKSNVKRGGRPPLDADSRRDIELTVIVNKKELETIKVAIEKSKERYPSVFYRKALLAAATEKTCNFKTVPEIDLRMLDELSKLGVNVNQIAKAVNTANKNGNMLDVDKEEMDKNSKRLAKVIKKLSKLFFAWLYNKK